MSRAAIELGWAVKATGSGLDECEGRLFRTERQVACFRKTDGGWRVTPNLQGADPSGDALSAQKPAFRGSFSKFFQAFIWILLGRLQQYQWVAEQKIEIGPIVRS